MSAAASCCRWPVMAQRGTATVARQAVELLASLTIEVPVRVLQNSIGDDLTVAAEVLAEGTQSNACDSADLELQVIRVVHSWIRVLRC